MLSVHSSFFATSRDESRNVRGKGGQGEMPRETQLTELQLLHRRDRIQSEAGDKDSSGTVCPELFTKT